MDSRSKFKPKEIFVPSDSSSSQLKANCKEKVWLRINVQRSWFILVLRIVRQMIDSDIDPRHFCSQIGLGKRLCWPEQIIKTQFKIFQMTCLELKYFGFW